MRHLELFSGTHSFGKVSSKLGYDVISLDRDLGAECPWTDYKSKTHIKEDIMTWDYTVYPKGYFKLITASPVCTWWSHLRTSWIGRKCKTIHPTETITMDILNAEIRKYGVPMVDKVFEILDYFNPEYYIIENPQSGKMKDYINDLVPYIDVYYCMWGFDYKKKTRFWTNLKLNNNKICNHYKHTKTLGHKNHGTTLKEKYRIPLPLIEALLMN